MEKQNNSSNYHETNKTRNEQSKQYSSADGMRSSRLMLLFEEELMEIYWVEKALIQSIPKLIKHASSKKLITSLEDHLEETKEQVIRLEDVFKLIDKIAFSKYCKAMEGFINEFEKIIETCDKDAVCDAEIISVVRKIENYEIASYGTLRQFAETLGLEDIRETFQASLNEEKIAEEKLSEVIISSANSS